MKIVSRGSKSLFQYCVLTGLLCLPGFARGATLSVSPTAVSNSYSGNITLQVGGLTNGETVVVQKFLDLNTNGVINASDWLAQQFQMTDGQAGMVIGGVTNFNVPGDTNTTAGQITARMNFQNGDFMQNIGGKFLFKLSSPSGHFTPITNLFTVTNSPYVQKITGNVVSGGVAVPNAVVLLFAAPRPGQKGPSGGPLAGVIANNSGAYTIPAPTGAYLAIAFKTNYVVNFGAPAIIALGGGTTITTNMTLTNATASISGKVADASNPSIGLPGILMIAEATNGLMGIGSTDTNGNFAVGVRSGLWRVHPDDTSLIVHGYPGLNDGTTVDTSTGSVANVTFALPRATAMVYGSVRDGLGKPLAGIDVYGEDFGNHQYQTDGYTDTNGNYFVAVPAGDWSVSISEDTAPTNYVFSAGQGQTLTNGQVVHWDFTAAPATNRISGHVSYNGNPVSGVSVWASANINGLDYQTQADTDTNGDYSLNVANGNWNVGLNCNGGDSSLDSILGSGNYQCPGNQGVLISGGNGTADFTIQPCTGVQILTTSLPDGQVNVYYDQFLQASACSSTFTWSVISGSPPPGLTGNPFTGEMYGTPTNAGTFNFTVHVDDGNGHSTNQNLSVYIAPASTPLQITTASLPNGTNGVFYSQTLQASGGQSPYHWYLPGGTITLPPGTMSLSDGGTLSGTPTAAGTYNFWIGVWDDVSSGVVTQYLSLTINAGSSPLQVMTTSLPNGTNGTFYTQQLQASGGQTPYHWRVADYSADLPANLTLATNGVLSGTLAVNGTNYFDVEVDDAAANTNFQTLSLYVVNPPLLITNASLPSGTVGAAYSAQLGATGGQQPYQCWSLALGSASLPSGLSLDCGGLISGTPTNNKVATFKVQATDANFTTTNKILSITINPKPVLSAPVWITNRFQMRLTGASNQNYSVQASTNLTSANWISLFVTNNAATNSFNIIDPTATNRTRFYRVLVGP